MAASRKWLSGSKGLNWVTLKTEWWNTSNAFPIGVGKWPLTDSNSNQESHKPFNPLLTHILRHFDLCGLLNGHSVFLVLKGQVRVTWSKWPIHALIGPKENYSSKVNEYTYTLFGLLSDKSDACSKRFPKHRTMPNDFRHVAGASDLSRALSSKISEM